MPRVTIAVPIFLAVALLAVNGNAQQRLVARHKSGMILGPGIITETDSVSTSAFQRGGDEGKSIGIMDDGLRLTYFSLLPNNVKVSESNASPLEEIELPSANEVARSGNPPNIQQLLGVDAFNKYGRRGFRFRTPQRVTEVLQGITLLTPKYAKVEVLNTDRDKFAWDTRIATASIPAGQLRAILRQALDLDSSNDWLRMVRFYMQAERYREASEVLTEAIQRFPTAMASRRPIIEQLDQFFATDKFDEIELREAAGQHLLAARYLGGFPVTTLPIESQVRLQDKLQSAQQRLIQIGKIADELKRLASKLSAEDQKMIQPIIAEILGELSQNTDERLADFNRLMNDESIAAEDRVAFAISGWILGPSAGIDNFAVAKSLVRVREQVERYLGDANPNQRQAIIQQLRGEEGAQPELLARLLATMKPPQLPPVIDEKDPPGLFRATTKSGVNYLVQVPPEYDPNRQYPCILALPGVGDSPELEINYWCGLYAKLAVDFARSGHATRYGYIVVSPDWMPDNQTAYKYTENEHARVLSSLRDAFRKFNIDTDRVFISGHFDGATAAWDIASAHPDLWAGLLPISPGADKFIKHYKENIKGRNVDSIPLGTYIVYGELDGKRINNSRVDLICDEYLKTSLYDSLVVSFRGRGSGLFTDEVEKMIEWMELSSHRRVRTPRFIDVTSMRSGDRFFYWLEAPGLLPTVAQNAYQIDPGAAGKFEAVLLDGTANGINVSKIPSPNKRCTIWLTLDMVDFSRPISISVAGRRRPHNLSPDIAVMLEDARTRGDRKHVFCQRVDL